MQTRFKTLFIQPIDSLRRFKSFFIIIFLLCLADRAIKLLKGTYHLNLKLPPVWRIDPEVSAKLLFQFPGVILKQMGDARFITLLLGLFLAKRIFSLWPASDLRLMHRHERGHFALLAAAGAIRLKQLLWFLLAQGAWGLAIGAWVGACFLVCRMGWHHFPSSGWLWGFGIGAGAMLPLMVAGFSFSNKLAVNALGTFGQKGRLLFKVVVRWPLAWRSWLFFLAWLLVEGLFIAGTTIFVLKRVDSGAMRFILAALLATPFYAYWEMAAFKLFLIAYENDSLIRQEYQRHYDRSGYGPCC
jgi:hypothetical protein